MILKLDLKIHAGVESVSTAEVGRIYLRHKRANKGVERIYITLENA